MPDDERDRQPEETPEQPEADEQAALIDEVDENLGVVKPRSIVEEMQTSYLDYAMSVIVARALPDVRDGLKPVHRRVLFSMHELGLRSGARYRKSATVVGDVLGKYHPHGDSAVYETLVRMAQPFAMRAPLVDGQGNFGSMDGDGAAAMRYTESRMTALAEATLTDIEKETIDWRPNYDDTRREPSVLPAKVPNLLLNGALGIAVGMATNIPPHNLGELIDGLTALIDNAEIDVEGLMAFIQGPDFPTGATIFNTEDIRTAYATGKGRIMMRAVAEVEETKHGHRIVVSELPYQVNKADLIAKIADLVKSKRIEGITDLRDESDRTSNVRIVIELKASAYPKKILNQLYDLTAMQGAFHVNMLALVDGIQPRVLTLKTILEEYLKHRITVITRRTQFELTKATDRAHILEGLKKALDEIDAVITTIRESETRELAHGALMGQFKLTDVQATAILEMRLSALAGLERKKVDDELAEMRTLIAELEAILASDAKIRAIIKAELKELKAQFANARRTTVVPHALGSFTAEDLIPNEQVVITITKENYVKRVPVDTYRTQARGGKGIVGMTTKLEDTVTHLTVANTHDDIFFFTDAGRVFVTKVYDLPTGSRQAKGAAIVNVIQVAQNENVTSVFTMTKAQREKAKYFFMGTAQGVVKKTLVEAYKNVRKSGIIAIRLNGDDQLRWVKITSGVDQVMMVSKKGQGIRFAETDVRPMGRSAAGVRGMKLRKDDEVVDLDVVTETLTDLLTVSRNGFGKRTKVTEFAPQRRGGFGLRAMKVTSRTGDVVSAQLVAQADSDLVLVSTHGQTIRTPMKSVKRLGRDTQGVTVMRLNKGDDVASVTLVPEGQEDELAKAEATAKQIALEIAESAEKAKHAPKPAELPKGEAPDDEPVDEPTNADETEA